jgi:homoserine/homoserine lactone efflux protein
MTTGALTPADVNTQTFLLYVATWSLVALSPGPAVMCSMAQSARHGFRASLAGISGIQAGNLFFFVCAALGLGALLATATTAFNILRFAGAIYLFYLGARIIVATFRQRMPSAAQTSAPPAAFRGLFLQGLLVQLTNPKALLFVSALLPQFIDARSPAPPQLLVMLLATVAIDYAVLSTYAFVARRGLQSFRAGRLSAWLERIFGAALVFFGFRLVLSRR